MVQTSIDECRLLNTVNFYEFLWLQTLDYGKFVLWIGILLQMEYLARKRCMDCQINQICQSAVVYGRFNMR